MIIAEKKKKENIAEYILYMWQVEDIIRANHFDMQAIRRSLIAGYEQPEEVKRKIERWYEALAEKMRLEGVQEKGHLQEITAEVNALTDLHLRLLASPEETLYRATYYQTLPYIVQLRAKSGGKEMPELETCLTALYGYLMLKMQQKEVSPMTEEAVKQVASFLAILAEKHIKHTKR
ncbi:MAG: DUF4924 family protein [Tannerellaceae bacterium]|jgi:hypothetical protein|nr:DUF4924 family protein [Tannerellaceae bacterium]